MRHAAGLRRACGARDTVPVELLLVLILGRAQAGPLLVRVVPPWVQGCLASTWGQGWLASSTLVPHPLGSNCHDLGPSLDPSLDPLLLGDSLRGCVGTSCCPLARGELAPA